MRKINAIPEEIPLFTMQGGIDKTKLRGIYKFMINMLAEGLSSKKERSKEDERMLHLLQYNKGCVNEENLTAVMEWYLQGTVAIDSTP